ncbi:peptidyl-prolyl cis-trans isomerase [Saliterribacillus persicus]|uniref:peptidylprolyl isomerase n=1 Tax=Saliterribacillus persicus TaxID=930114 RepID=A0A368X9A3_9BACI|nr:peptidyl-prolyl cis-trans isomerase [Saliterribacillus persicus]RCW63027.1 foldase protein PrsA [Saliterribacillus persicus]
MPRKYLWGVILLLLIVNIFTIMMCVNEKDQVEVQNISGTKNGVNEKEPVAEIDGDEIEYKTWVNELLNEHGKQTLREMINHEVVFQLAEENNIEVEDKTINREIARLMTLEDVLTKEEREEKREKWEEEIRYRFYLEQLLTEDIEVSDAELEDYFAEYERQYNFTEMFQLSHIVVNSESQAQLALEALEEGASFQEVSREYSTDEDTRDSGGYLGFYTDTSSFLSDEYFVQVKELKEETYSDPFSVGNSQVIVYLHQNLPEITFTFEEAYEEVRRDVALDKLEQNVDPSLLWEQYEIDWIYED